MKGGSHSVGTEELYALMDAARDFARSGGDMSRQWFRHEVEVERKGDLSPVTVADKTIELHLREMIARRFPSHAIVGEEHGGAISGRGYEWVLDPIDGTKSFIHGVPLYTTLVALLVDGYPLVGVIYNPISGEMVSAARGCGAWNEYGVRVSVRQTSTLSEAWLMTTDVTHLLRCKPRWASTLLTSCRTSRTWADGYGYLMLACGRADVMVDPEMHPWDIAPLSVIIEEAGGVITTIDGDDDPLGGSCLACATEGLHREVLSLMA